MTQPLVMRPTICILSSFSPIARDAQVLRQIAALAPQHNLLHRRKNAHFKGFLP